MTFYGSLPPLLDTAIEGELHLIILRPVLNPPLQPNQVIEFSFTWFGDSSDYKACLRSHEDEINLPFSIRCDSRGFRRYLRDAKNLKVYIKVKGGNGRSGPSPRSIKNRKEWKDGDQIGNFVLANLKLNSRGWYIKECPIQDNYNNCWGNINVYMVYSDKFELQSPLKDFHTKNLSPRSDNETKDANLEGKKNRTLNDKPSASRPLTFKGDKKRKKVLIKEAPSNEDHNLTFQNKNNKMHLDSSNLMETAPLSPSQQDQIPVKEPRKAHLANTNFMMTDLFSLVDSKFISKSQLPLLMQLYQGQSPSCEFANPSSDPTQSMEYYASLNIADGSSRDTGTISGISTLAASPDSKMSNKEFQVGNHVLKEAQIENAAKDETQTFNSSVMSPLDEEGFENDHQTHQVNQSCSVLVLQMNSLTLNIGNLGIPKAKETSTVQPKVSIPVRQRSKLCYIVNFSFDYGSKKQEDEITFVSRRVEDGAIQFHSDYMMRLPPLEFLENGVVKIKVVRRILGKMHGEEVAYTVIMLKEILQSTHCTAYKVQLWLPNSHTNSKALKKPIGSIHFNTIFAFSPSHNLLNKTKPQITSESHQQETSAYDHQGSYIHYIDKCYPKHTSKINEITSEITKKAIANEDDNSQIELCHSPPQKMLPEVLSGPEILSQKDSLDTVGRDSEACLSPIEECFNKYAIHLEIVEAQNLPLVELGGETFEPSCYAKASIKPYGIKTNVISSTCNPIWDFEADVAFEFADLKETNGHLIVKVYHSLDEANIGHDDPLIGFASVDTRSLQSGLVSLCGWYPLLNITGKRCGSIKVSLTPHEPQKQTSSEVENNIYNEENSNEVAPYRPPSNIPDMPPTQAQASVYEIPGGRGFHCACCRTSKETKISGQAEEEILRSPSEDKENEVMIDVQIPRNPSCASPVSREKQNIPLQRCFSNDSYIVKHRQCDNIFSPHHSNNAYVLEEIPITQGGSGHFSDDELEKCQTLARERNLTSPQPLINPNIDAFTWMNRMNLDSPSGSYMSMYSQTNNSTQTRAEINRCTEQRQIRKRKTRIAAQLNFY